MAEAPRTLVLVRHGRTAWNAEGRAQGHADVSLDDVGRDQAAQLGRNLVRTFAGHDVRRLWSSDLSRASETALELSGSLGLAVAYDERLREFDVGERQGLTTAEYDARRGGEPSGLVGYLGSPTPAGAEDVEMVRTRMSAALSSCLDALAAGETGVVVTHGAALRVGLLDLLDWPWERVVALAPVRNCHWAEVCFPTPEQAVLVAYNTSG